ncbi:MAG: agmatine deiminase family protein, partial [Calditrichia bacterium]|nr:agmatine deiminase family protein [Calditrichia bacterium]
MKLFSIFNIMLILSVFYPSAVDAQTRRIPAEWEPQKSTWMQWPRASEASNRDNFSGIIDALQEYEHIDILVASESEKTAAQNFLAGNGVPETNIVWHIIPYDWAWMRDNGPVWIDVNGSLIVQDWGFDGWGGVVPYWNNDDAVPPHVASAENVSSESYSLINERGTLEFNGVDALITSWPCLSDRNPGISQDDMEAELKAAFGVTTVVWLLSYPPGDLTKGHVDGIARFINEDTVVVARYVDQSDPDAPVYEEAATIIQEAGFQVLRLDVPGKVNYLGSEMEANYTNWLVANGVVILCGFGAPEWDNAAKTTVEGYFPGRDVIVTDVRELWYNGGGVHCVTNDQPAAPVTTGLSDPPVPDNYRLCF